MGSQTTNILKFIPIFRDISAIDRYGPQTVPDSRLILQARLRFGFQWCHIFEMWVVFRPPDAGTGLRGKG